MAKIDQDFRKAIRAGDIKKMDRLVEMGADVNLKEEGNYFETPLSEALSINNLAVCRRLLDYPKIDVNQTFHGGYSPLSWAKDASIARRMINMGADIHYREPFYKRTALERHIEKLGSADIVEFLERKKIIGALLDRGAEIPEDYQKQLDNLQEKWADMFELKALGKNLLDYPAKRDIDSVCALILEHAKQRASGDYEYQVSGKENPISLKGTLNSTMESVGNRKTDKINISVVDPNFMNRTKREK